MPSTEGILSTDQTARRDGVSSVKWSLEIGRKFLARGHTVTHPALLDAARGKAGDTERAVQEIRHSNLLVHLAFHFL